VVDVVGVQAEAGKFFEGNPDRREHNIDLGCKQNHHLDKVVYV
jgi:hypothetical protein